MNRIYTYMIGLFMGISLSIGVVSIAPADTTNEGSDYLVEIGKMYFDKGQKEDAAHEFSKALLLNPENLDAKKYLNQMGLKEGLYKPTRTNLTEAVEAPQKIKVYEQKMAQLQQEKVAREAMFQQVESDRDRLLKDNKAKEEELRNLKVSAVPDLGKSDEDKIAVKNIPAQSPKSQFYETNTVYVYPNQPAELHENASVLVKAPTNLYEKSDAYKSTMASLDVLQRSMRARKEFLVMPPLTKRNDAQLTNMQLALAKTQHRLLSQMNETIELQDLLVDTQNKYIHFLDEAISLTK